MTVTATQSTPDNSNRCTESCGPSDQATIKVVMAAEQLGYTALYYPTTDTIVLSSAKNEGLKRTDFAALLKRIHDAKYTELEVVDRNGTIRLSRSRSTTSRCCRTDMCADYHG